MSPRKSRLRFSVRVSCSLMMRRYRGAQRTRWTAGQHSSRKTNFLPGLPTSYFLPPSHPSPTTTPWRFKNKASLQSTDPPSLPPRSLLPSFYLQELSNCLSALFYTSADLPHPGWGPGHDQKLVLPARSWHILEGRAPRPNLDVRLH